MFTGFRRDYHLIHVPDYDCRIQTEPASATGSAIMVFVWPPPEATPAKYDDKTLANGFRLLCYSPDKITD
jgi:hypothetical protein